MQDHLIKQHVKTRRIVPFQQFLTTHSNLGTLMNYPQVHFWRNGLNDTLSIFFRLQQTWHVAHRVTGDNCSFLFQSYKRIQIKIVVFCPPAWLTSLTRKAHEFSRSGLVDFVQCAQVTHVPKARTTYSSLQAADLGDRAEQPCRDFLYSHAFFVTKPAQTRTKFALTRYWVRSGHGSWSSSRTQATPTNPACYSPGCADGACPARGPGHWHVPTIGGLHRPCNTRRMRRVCRARTKAGADTGSPRFGSAYSWVVTALTSV